MALTKDERAAINRENARKSTGPRSAEGKAASARNALTHGLTARVVAVLPDEDPAEHAAFVAAWVDDYRPAGAGRRALVERAADIAWKLRRAGRIDAAHLAHRARTAAEAHDVEQLRRAEALGDLLRVEEPDIVAVDARGLRRTPRNRPHPAAVVRELETFLAGLRWLLARWAGLRALLDDDGYWDRDAVYLAVRLLGARPEDLMLELGVRRVFACCNAVNPTGATFTDDAFHATIGWPGRSYNKFRAVELNVETPPAREAMATLRGLIDAEETRLAALLPELEARAALDRAEAPTRALADVAPALAPLHRYESSLDRALRLAVVAIERPAGCDVAPEDTFPFAAPAIPDEVLLASAAFPEPEPRPEPEPEPEPEPARAPVVAPPAVAASAPAPAADPAPARPARPPIASPPEPRRNEANAPAAPAVAPAVAPRHSCWAPPQLEVA